MLRNYLTLLILGIIFTTSCRPDPDPEPGFTKSLYTSAIFDGQTYVWESDKDEVQVGWISQEAGHGLGNILTGNSSAGELEIAMHFGKSVERSDITDLEGKTIASGPGDGFPYLKVFWINPNGNDYTNVVDEIDYGPGTVTIDQVQNTGRITYKDPLSGAENRGRSFIVRGSFDFNISSASWSISEPVELFPFEDGQFSMRLVVPD